MTELTLSEKIRDIEDEREQIESRINKLKSFEKGSEMYILGPQIRVGIPITKNDLPKGFFDDKMNKLQERKNTLQQKIEQIKDIIND